MLNMGAILSGVVSPSTLDFLGHSSLVLFFGGCNFRCPWCYNYKLIPQHGKHYTDKMLERLVKQNKKAVDAVVATGGEPTLQDKGCESLFRIAHKYGLLTMLNTNGSNSMCIIDLVEKGLVDKVAMDVKSPFDPIGYLKMTGSSNQYVYSDVKESLQLVKRLEVPLEVRTTVIRDSYSHGKALYTLIDQVAPFTSEFHLQEFDDRDVLDPSLRGKSVGRDELLVYAKYAKSKNIDKVLTKTRSHGIE